MNRRLRILVTNDDGIEAPGIGPLALAAARAGHEVVLAAPARQWSGASAAILVDDDADQVSVERRHAPRGVAESWAVHAAPAMCVLLALRGSFGARPDAVLSGINYGANTGRVLLHSGTAGAALTAGVGGVAAVAVSLDVGFAPPALHWDDAADTAVALLPLLREQGAAAVLNVNVPNAPGPHAYREAPLATGGVVQTTTPEAEEDEESVRVALSGADEGSDLDLLARGFATVTALTPPAAVPLVGRLPR